MYSKKTSLSGDARAISHTSTLHPSLIAIIPYYKLHVYLASHRIILFTMASKRRQDERDKTEKKKKKNCDVAAPLCSVVEDEQVKRAVKEAWSQKTHYSQGWWKKTQ